MSAAYDHKMNYLSDLAQVILLDQNGDLIESCNTLIDLSTYTHTSLFDLFPILESIYPILLNMGTAPKDKVYLPRVEFQYNEKEWIFDFLFHKKENSQKQPAIIWILQDLTDQYQYLLKVQQERNESIIAKEFLVNKNKALSLEKEIEKRNQIYKVKLKYSATISEDLQPNTKKIEQTLQKLKLYAKQQPELTNLTMTIKHINKILIELLNRSNIKNNTATQPTIALPKAKTAFSLEELMRNIGHIFDYQQAKSIPFITNIQPKTNTQLYGNPIKLANIIYNISKNLLKINHSGKVIIRIFEDQKIKAKKPKNITLYFEIKSIQTNFDPKIIAHLRQFNLAGPNADKELNDIDNMQMEIAVAQKLLEMQGETLQIQSNQPNEITFSFQLTFPK